MLLDIDSRPLKGWRELNVHTPGTVNAFHPSQYKKHALVTKRILNVKYPIKLMH